MGEANVGLEAKKCRPIKRLKNMLTVGNLWLYILSLINEKGKVYGYGLDEEIEKTFFFRPSQVMIYLVLYRLEDEGLIKSEIEKRRKYYTATEKGVETLRLAKEYFTLLGRRL